MGIYPQWNEQDFQNYPAHNFRFATVSTVPTTPLARQIITLSADNGGLQADHTYQYNATEDVWVDLTANIDPTAVVSRAANAAAAGELLVSGGADKSVDSFVDNGLVKIVGGIVDTAVEGTDYLTASSTNTLTNKTINANGTGNAISNLEVADFAASAITTDVASASTDDSKFATDTAVKAYVDAIAGKTVEVTTDGIENEFTVTHSFGIARAGLDCKLFDADGNTISSAVFSVIPLNLNAVTLNIGTVELPYPAGTLRAVITAIPAV